MQPSTGDYMDYKLKGKLKNFNVEAFYNKNTAANILAFHTLRALNDAYMVYDSRVADYARRSGHDKILQYLRNEGCPEPSEDTDESSGSEEVGSDEEDGDN